MKQEADGIHIHVIRNKSFDMFYDLEAVEICVEDVSALDVGDQSHCQLFIGLISDVHHGGDVDRQPVHT